MAAILGSFVFCVLLWIMFENREAFLGAWKSRHWKSTSAQITDIQDHTYLSDVVTKYSGSSVVERKSRNYTFSYVVNDASYQSNRYAFDDSLIKGESDIRKGDKVTIFYDPINPQESVVIRGLSLNIVWMPLLALYVLLWTLWQIM